MKGDECLSNLKNIAVYEGQRNIILNLYINPLNVSWKVVSTSDEYDIQNIIDLGGKKNTALSTLYDVNQTGLIIRSATTTSGISQATAGLYVGQCANNTNRTGAKLLVVRSGPLCSRVANNANSSDVSCKVTFADCSLQPIRPIITWKRNGAYLASYTLLGDRNDPNVFNATSTITSSGGTPANYTCELTFAAPTDIAYPWIAANAPEFNKSCSTTG